VSAALLERLPGLFKGMPRNQIGTKAHALGLDNVISSEDIVRYLKASPEERNRQLGAYRSDVIGLNLDQKSQRSWQDFLTQMERAGLMIENTFVRGLTPLAEPLEKLSKSVADLIDSALGSGTLKEWINEAAGGVESFAKFIGKPEFKQDVESFVSGIGTLAHSVADALRWLGILPEAKGVAGTVPGPAGELPYGAGSPDTGLPRGQRWAFTRAWRTDLAPSTINSDAHAWGRLHSPDFGAAVQAMGDGVAGAGGALSRSDELRMARQAAINAGIDPDQFVRMLNRENRQGILGRLWDDPSFTGQPGQSGGLESLRYPGLGTEYTRATGHTAGDPRYVQQELDWTASYIGRTRSYQPWTTMRNDPFMPYAGAGTRPSVTLYDATGADTVVTTRQAVGE
jgi:hypothetical protein